MQNSHRGASVRCVGVREACVWLCACDRFALAEFELSLLFPAVSL